MSESDPSPEPGGPSPRQAFADAAGPPTEDPSHTGWTPPSLEELAPEFSGFRLEKLLGRGGMGAVYRAEQISLKRSVAIKILPRKLAENPEFNERFRNEAIHMAKLDHPNIVSVYDFGQTDSGYCYFVMEYVDGMDFQKFIRAGRFGPEKALPAVSQICAALHYAHERGFVHRDIKPANIFLSREGDVKIGDFGIAKLMTGGEPEPGITMTGCGLGSLYYSAPEQLTGGKVDRRADIYSLGVMFYEMLTGELPRGDFDPPSKKVRVDVRIDDVVYRAMEAEPEMRYRTAAEIQTDVEGATAKPDDVNSETEPPKRGWKKFALAIGVVVALASGMGIYQWSNRPAADTDPESASAPEIGPENIETSSATGFFPPQRPVLPLTRPNIPCRLVVLPLQAEAAEKRPGWVDNLEKEDRTDVVAIDITEASPLLLHTDGSLSGWWKWSEAAERLHRFGDITKIGGRSALDSEGRLFSLDPRMQSALTESGTLYTDAYSDNWGGLAVRSDGTLFAHGRLIPGKPELAHFLRELDDCVSIGCVGDMGTILHGDGTVSRWQEFGTGKKLMTEKRVLGSCARITRFADYGLSSKGKVIVVGMDINPMIPTPVNASETAWKSIRSGFMIQNEGPGDYHTSSVSLIGENGEMRIWRKRLKAYPDPRFSKALAGAVDIRFHGREVFALLPADTVPRAGYWTLDQLVEARRIRIE